MTSYALMHVKTDEAGERTEIWRTPWLATLELAYRYAAEHFGYKP